MKKAVLLLLFLMACTQNAVEISPTGLVVNCEKRSAGEACGCACAKPLTCIEGTCLLTDRAIDEGCIANKQCLTGWCEEERCKQKDTPIGVFECERFCDGNDRSGCTTRCGFG